ncbi:hypothetical protein LTR17_003091 [Elasticomyces elasticus]|nr:hypothetical protein LTR17_003091 [Elasticomyces elasticus]
MTSVDDLFRNPGLPLPSGNLKRKLEIPDAERAYKATKLSPETTVEDVPEEDDDLEAGPELPPDDEEAEDGDRFFGGGVTKSSAAALDYLDQQQDSNNSDGGETYTAEKIDSAWLRRLAVTFEKKVTRNAEQRARYEAEPQKFMVSEADLDAEIKSWSLLAEHPELFAEFAGSGSVGLLVGLVGHENTDIAIAALEILAELLDEDVDAQPDQWDALVSALLEADLLDLLLSNLARLDETLESDRSGVYHSLSILESLSGQRATAELIGTPNLLTYLCRRLEKTEKVTTQNKQYAAEVLQILLQTSPLLRKRLALEIEGIDLLCQLLAAYRKRDPNKSTPEEEFAENVFDALTCTVDEPNGKIKFVEAEGVELALLMLKEGGFSKPRALRLLDHACGGPGQAVCEKLVDAAGLKPVLGMFGKKVDGATTEHLLGIFASLLRCLPGESGARIRTIAKFTEKGNEKITKLLGLRTDYARRVGAVESEIESEREGLSAEEVEVRADEDLSRRLDAGLYVLQTLDVILAWLVAEDRGVRGLVEDGGGLGAVRAGLREQLKGLDDDGDGEVREMLGTLLELLK